MNDGLFLGAPYFCIWKEVNLLVCLVKIILKPYFDRVVNLQSGRKSLKPLTEQSYERILAMLLSARCFTFGIITYQINSTHKIYYFYFIFPFVFLAFKVT